MSAISQKSITGITSITTPAGVDNQLTLHTNDTSEKLRITSEGKLGINNSSPVSIIHAIGNNTVGTSVTMTLQAHDTVNAIAGINLLARRLDNVNETCNLIKDCLERITEEFENMTPEEIILHREKKYLEIGNKFIEN